MDTFPTLTNADDNVTVEANPFAVCLQATDKGDSSMYKLLKFNVSNGDERLISEVANRKDCVIAFLKGRLNYRLEYVEYFNKISTFVHVT